MVLGSFNWLGFCPGPYKCPLRRYNSDLAMTHHCFRNRKFFAILSILNVQRFEFRSPIFPLETILVKYQICTKLFSSFGHLTDLQISNHHFVLDFRPYHKRKFTVRNGILIQIFCQHFVLNSRPQHQRKFTVGNGILSHILSTTLTFQHIGDKVCTLYTVSVTVTNFTV